MVAIFAALSLSAMAEESPPKKPAPKAPATAQAGNPGAVAAPSDRPCRHRARYKNLC